MANATIGSSPGTNDWAADASMHQCWLGNYVMAGLGRMFSVSTFFAAWTGGGAGGAVAWLNSVFSGLYEATTIGAGNISTGGGGATRTSNNVNIPADSGDLWQFGFYCANGCFAIYQSGGTNSFFKGSAITNATGGTNLSAYGTGAGAITAQGTYFILEFYERVAGAWQKRWLSEKIGGVESIIHLDVRRSSTWTEVGRLAENIEFDPYRSHPVMFKDKPSGLWVPGIARWEGPIYLGPPGAREILLHGEKALRPAPYVLSRAA